MRYPAVTLEFDFVDSEQAYHDVEQGLRELAIVTLPDEPQASVTAVPVWRERLIPCVQRDHPLARGKEVAIADLAGHRAVLLGGHTFTQQKVDQLFAAHRVELQDRTSSSYLEAIAMLVTAGQGWALLPDIIVRDELVALNVQPAIAIERSLGVVHHRDRTLSNAGRALVQLLRAAGIARLKGVLLYGIARASTQPEAGRLRALAAHELESIAAPLRAAGLTVPVSP